MPEKAVQQGRSERRAEAYPLGYVEGLNDARTLLADFFSILLDGLGHDHVGQFAEQSFGFFPAETGIGDGNAVGQRFPCCQV